MTTAQQESHWDGVEKNSEHQTRVATDCEMLSNAKPHKCHKKTEQHCRTNNTVLKESLTTRSQKEGDACIDHP